MIIRCISTEPDYTPAIQKMLPTDTINSSDTAIDGLYKAAAENADVVVMGKDIKPKFRLATVKAMMSTGKYSVAGENEYVMVLRNGSRRAADIANLICNTSFEKTFLPLVRCNS